MCLISCFILISNVLLSSEKVFCRELFEVEFEWNYLNYSWLSSSHYTRAFESGQYIPENVAFTGIKVFKNKLFLTTPKLRTGVPATLTYIPLHSREKVNNALIPYPNWAMNDDSNCKNLQSVQSLEIDPQGIMWVIDGVRVRHNTNCPCKLLLLDLNDSGKLIHSYVFPNEVCLQKGAFLNDIVLDRGYAYMTDASSIDPGLIVYSVNRNRAWKLRDGSMFPEKHFPMYSVDGTPVTKKVPIDGIALSPEPTEQYVDRILFYSPLTDYSIFSIPTRALKHMEFYEDGKFRDEIKLVGIKRGATDGMMMDNEGNLYYTLVTHDAVVRWNTNTSFDEAVILHQDNESMIWPDSFGMDQRGYLYMTSNYIHKFIDPSVELKLSSSIMFRIWKYHAGTKSYLYN